MKNIVYTLIIMLIMIGCSKTSSSDSSAAKSHNIKVKKKPEEPKGFKTIHQRDWEKNHKDSLKTKKEKVEKGQEVIHYK